MGRKPAPQPLALSGEALPTSDHRLPETLKIVSPDEPPFTSSTRSPASPPPLSSPYRQGQAQNHTTRPAQPQSQPPSVPQAQPQQKYQQPLHVADLVQQPLDDIDSPGYPPLSNPASATGFGYTQAQQLPQQGQLTYQQQQPYGSQQQQQQQQQQQPHNKSHGRHRQNDDKASKSSNFFFHFGKSSTAAKSSERLASSSTAPVNSTTSQQFADQRSEIASRGYGSPSSKQTFNRSDHNAQLRATTSSGPTRSEASLVSSATEVDTSSSSTPTGKKGKQKVFNRLGRTRSIHDDNNTPHPLNSNTSNTTASSANSLGFQRDPGTAAQMRVVDQPERAHQPTPSLKTAPPAQHDRSFREMMSSSHRNHSADRALGRDVPNNRDNHHGHRGDRGDHSRAQPSSLRDNGGYTFFNGLKNSSRSAADMISKGLFGKNGRSGGAPEPPVVDDEHYVLKVINQPLREQTRLTRISKRLEDSRDRTEFWMPAFPWRAIDYLNYKGTDVEGLYRVPGSGPQIKKWQRKFDEEYDVDLFTQDDLYDINIIGSMLKAWLRELPDELFPKEAQERIARECAGAETVPQMLVDELSNLPPFNYYLLFAITCHLSLLLAHSDRNKMDFRNLCICFQPCMKIDAFSFKFLVCDWRDCWKGCINEPQYIEEEYRLFDMPPPRGIGTVSHDDEENTMDVEIDNVQRPPPAVVAGGDDRAPDRGGLDRQVSSSDSGAQYGNGNSNGNSNNNHSADKPRSKKKTATAETGSVASNETLSTTLTIESQRVTTPPTQSGDLRPLSPIKPLSPLGF
ncbi:hypothetical protein HMPREF1624_07793 [Sporothrix schenckii ATCC 58251]|uniref:Rho-GAP domain-containing protein n=1 Tax=Sporothrix schenckii (strain ATCC 58251 / de Perez 2211183) TaxID=1391915 RepID=U7PJ95_SPOS1|nr:hypothetical protein HMPREF1624_07793 [Sporothrix schenckii ATCC 58251]